MQEQSNFKKYVVRDFYRELKDNETLINYPHFRALSVIDETGVVVCDAILEKPKNRKKWIYKLCWAHNGEVLKKYITPFRAVEKNRKIFNKKSRKLAAKFIVLLENNEQLIPF